jgi:hypothetical protein
MSNQLSALIDTLAIAGIVGVCFLSGQAFAPAPHRSPASVEPMSHKELVLSQGMKFSNLRHTEKLHGPIDVAIQLVGPAPEKSGDVFTLQATVASSESLQNVNYSWSIPEGIEVINGQTGGSFDRIDEEVPGVLEVTLRQLSSQNQQIHLLAGTHDGRRHFAESAQYNSELQAHIDAKKQALKEITEEETSGQNLKVFH